MKTPKRYVSLIRKFNSDEQENAFDDKSNLQILRFCTAYPLLEGHHGAT